MTMPPPTPRSPERRPPPSPIASSFGSSASDCRRARMARHTNVWAMSFSTRPELRGTFGMVASTHWLASAAGMAVLEQGGNAFDAAVAAGFTLQVVEPHLNGPGGDLPALVWPAGARPAARPLRAGPRTARGDDRALPRRARARADSRHRPAGRGRARRLRRLDRAAARVRDAAARTTSSTSRSATPRTAIRPSRRSATRSARSSSSSPRTGRRPWTSTSRLPSRGRCTGTASLAETYRRILAEAEAASTDRDAQLEAAHDCWYRGFVAEEIVRFQEREWLDSSRRAPRGPARRGATCATGRRPGRSRSRSTTTATRSSRPARGARRRSSSSSSGCSRASTSAPWARRARSGCTPITECAKLAFADREAWYGDPDFADVPLADAALARLRGGAARAARRGGVARAPARLARRPGAPAGAAGRGRAGRARRRRADARATPSTSTSSTAAGTWSRRRRAAAGSGALPSSPRSASRLGTRAQMFWLEEGLPNSLEPGKRPRTTLSPTLAARGGEPYLALGTPGRRPAGPVDAARLPRPRPPRPRPPGRDRRAEPPHRGVPVELLSARDAARGTSRSRSASAPRRSTGCGERGHDVEVSGPWTLGRVTAVGARARTGS